MKLLTTKNYVQFFFEMKNFFCLWLIFRVTANPFGHNRWNPYQVQNQYGPSLTHEEVNVPNDDKPVIGLYRNECNDVLKNKYSMKQNNYDQFKPNEYEYSRNGPADCLPHFEEIQCSYDYDPICARSDASGHVETFRNECELKQRFCLTQTPWHIIHKGPCIRACRVRCPDSYYPICAYCSDEMMNITFINECHFKCRISLGERGDCRIIKSGTCSQEDFSPSDYEPHAYRPSISTFLIELNRTDEFKPPFFLPQTFNETAYNSPPSVSTDLTPPHVTSMGKAPEHFNKTTQPFSRPRGLSGNPTSTPKIPRNFNRTTISPLPSSHSPASPKMSRCLESFNKLQETLMSIASEVLKYFNVNETKLFLIYNMLTKSLSDFGENFCNDNANITSVTKPTAV